MTAALLLHKPANPHQFLAAFLTKVEAKGLEAELNRGELEIMFQTFDVTNTGFVSVQQTNQVQHIRSFYYQVCSKTPLVSCGQVGTPSFGTKNFGAFFAGIENNPWAQRGTPG